jgi:hypothetical protein
LARAAALLEGGGCLLIGEQFFALERELFVNSVALGVDAAFFQLCGGELLLSELLLLVKCGDLGRGW